MKNTALFTLQALSCVICLTAGVIQYMRQDKIFMPLGCGIARKKILRRVQKSDRVDVL